MSFVSDFKKLTLVLAVSASSMLICNGCVTALVGATAAGAGAFIGSDSRTVDVQVDDQKIENQVARILKNDRMRSDSKVFRVDCVSVNGNVLLVGQTRDTEYMNWALGYIKKVPNVKRIFNCVSNKDPIKASVIAHDAFITSKVKSALLFGSKISSGRFKVYTEDSVVYLLGYITRDEGQRAINQTRKVGGIKKIHPIFDYMDASGTPNSSDGAPVAVPSQDMVLGIYYLTMDKMVDHSRDEEIVAQAGDKLYGSEEEIKEALDAGKLGTHDYIRYDAGDRIVVCEPIDVLGHYFSDENQAILAYENGDISLHQKIRVKRKVFNGKGEKVEGVISTTLGRCLFNEILPQDLGFVKRETDEDYLKFEVDFHVGKKGLKQILEKVINNHGATKTAEVLDNIKAMGYKFSTRAAMTVSISDMTVPEAKKTILAEAEKTVDKITKHFRRGFLTDEERYKEVIETWQEADNQITTALLGGLDKYNNIFMMADSGARGSDKQIKQLAGMRGLMADTTGKTIELPIKSNFREGLDVLEYFISAHGARKGMSDTALRTADSGYLTRRLVDVSQDLIIRDVDCCEGKAIPYMEIESLMDGSEVIESLEERITGRTAAETMYDADGNVIVKANHMITPKRAAAIIATGVDKVKIRTILTCKSHVGVCAKCYGANMATGQRVQVGEAVGIIAAQSIGEPGTQLTMRTFHSGGVAGDDITQGLPRVEELFEARKPKGLAIIAEFGGRAEIKETRKKREVVVTNEETGESKAYLIPYGSRIKILDGTMLEAGDELTEGSINPHDLLKIKGLRAVQDYMIREVQRVYRLQGVEINDKHVEVIVRQMLKKIKVDTAGDSEFLPGTTVEVLNFNEVNEELEAQGKEPATGTQIMLGITKASLATNSFLSAASFQETTRVLTEAAISGKVDPLVGIKENVLIGKLIPAGTGIERYRSVKLSTDKNQVPEDEEVLLVSEDEEVLAVSEDAEGNETLEVSETIEVTEE